MTNLSLGAKMRENQIKATAAAEDAKRVKAEEEDAKNRKDRAKVVAFFDDAKQEFVADILSGKLSVQLELRSGGKYSDAYRIMEVYRWNDPWARISEDSKHKYHDVWLEFSAWAAENDLVAKWEYAHNFADDAWQVLSVAPRT